MKNRMRLSLACCLALVLSRDFARAEPFPGDRNTAGNINAFLEENFSRTNVAIVIGLLDEHGSQIFSTGKLDNGTDREPDGDTLFEIASITKTFTVLLLEQMVERGEMKLEDPLQKYLPDSRSEERRVGKECMCWWE